MKKRVKEMLPVVFIIAVTIITSLMLYGKVIELEEARAWKLLDDAAQSVANEIKMKFQDEAVKLRLVADMMIEDDRIDENQVIYMHLDSFQPTTIFSRIDVLYPDNTALLYNATRKVAGIDVDFDEVAAKGEHITSRYTDPETGKESIYYCVPVKDDKQTFAILIGVVESNKLAEVFKSTIYNSQVNFCIIDSKDGKYIMDNWHSTLGNAYNDLERKRLKGYEDVDLKEEIRNLRIGVIAFQSKTTGKPLYMYYMPSGIYTWQLAIFVQEDVVFENLIHLQNFLFVAGGIEALLLIIYFAWNLLKVSQLEKSKEETERQLEISNTLIQCVTELTSGKDIYISINNLLEIINQYFKSDSTYIFEYDSNKNTLSNTYEYVERRAEDSEKRVIFEAALSKIQGNSYFKENDSKNIQNKAASHQSLTEELIEWIKSYNEALTENNGVVWQNDLSSPIKFDKDGGDCCIVVPLCKNNIIIGFVGIDNPRKHFNDTKLLSSVQFFITSSLLGEKEQQHLITMSYRDMMTSLYNRNKYIQMLDFFSKQTLQKTGVIYIDLNGLKQVNDLQSHEAGDNFIRSAAKVISQVFEGKAYRIGGDEFVVLETDVDSKQFFARVAECRSIMRRENVNVSMGELWQEVCSDLEEMLKAAEQKMYKEKEDYYKTHERHIRRH